MSEGLMISFFIAIIIIGGGILFLMMHGRKTGRQLDVNKYRKQWLSIERQLQRDQESSYHLTILNADKLLDHALRQSGAKGNTMGERMKASQAAWSNANAVWSAHKIRNQIAHEAEVRVTYDEARRSLAAFKQGLKDLGAI